MVHRYYPMHGNAQYPRSVQIPDFPAAAQGHLFENPYKNTETAKNVLLTDETKRLALEAAKKSIEFFSSFVGMFTNLTKKAHFPTFFLKKEVGKEKTELLNDKFGS